MGPLNFSLEVLMRLVGAVLITCERVFEVRLLLDYLRCDDLAWMGLTWACLWLPSTVGIAAASVKAIRDRKWDDFIKPIAFYASFPISSVAWRIMLAFESLIGEDTALVKDYECSALFNIFHSCLESAPQITLQMYIIITTWGDKVCTGYYHSHQTGLIAISLLGLSKGISDVKFWTLRGEIPGLSNMFSWIPTLVYCIFHVSLRLMSYAFLSAQYLYYAATILPLQFISNLMIGHYICRDCHLSSKLVNAAMSLVAPAVYNLKDEYRHHRYCRWASITFAINLSITALALNLMSYFDVIEISSLKSAFLGLDPMHPNAMGWGVLSVITATVLVSAVSAAFGNQAWQWCRQWQEPFDRLVIDALSRAKVIFGCQNGDESPGKSATHVRDGREAKDPQCDYWDGRGVEDIFSPKDIKLQSYKSLSED